MEDHVLSHARHHRKGDRMALSGWPLRPSILKKGVGQGGWVCRLRRCWHGDRGPVRGHLHDDHGEQHRGVGDAHNAVGGLRAGVPRIKLELHPLANLVLRGRQARRGDGKSA